MYFIYLILLDSILLYFILFLFIHLLIYLLIYLFIYIDVYSSEKHSYVYKGTPKPKHRNLILLDSILLYFILFLFIHLLIYLLIYLSIYIDVYSSERHSYVYKGTPKPKHRNLILLDSISLYFILFLSIHLLIYLLIYLFIYIDVYSSEKHSYVYKGTPKPKHRNQHFTKWHCFHFAAESICSIQFFFLR